MNICRDCKHSKRKEFIYYDCFHPDNVKQNPINGIVYSVQMAEGKNCNGDCSDFEPKRIFGFLCRSGKGITPIEPKF